MTVNTNTIADETHLGHPGRVKGKGKGKTSRLHSSPGSPAATGARRPFGYPT